MPPILQWRLMTERDKDAVAALAAQIYPDLPERAEVLAEKRRLAPQSCFALAERGALYGYILAHGWQADNIPALDCFLHSLPAETETLYLHDMALADAARGQNLAQAGLEILFAAAARGKFKYCALTAVHNSAPFWRKQGFAAQPPQAGSALAHSLSLYGADAVYMRRALRGDAAQK